MPAGEPAGVPGVDAEGRSMKGTLAVAQSRSSPRAAANLVGSSMWNEAAGGDGGAGAGGGAGLWPQTSRRSSCRRV